MCVLPKCNGTLFVFVVLLLPYLIQSRLVYPSAEWDTPTDTCRTPTGRIGTCVTIKSCPSLISALENSPRPLPQSLILLLQRSQCGFEGSQPKVCCPPEPATQRPPIEKPFSQRPPDVRRHPNLRLLRLDICGPVLGDRIINGNKTGVFEVPWMALIAYNTKRGLGFRCGGTLINDNYILTAAHCISNLSPNLKLAGVRLGEHDIRTELDCERNQDGRLCAAPVQDFMIAEAIPHPEYSPTKLQNDIGLIRLGTPVNYTGDYYETVRPVCLPFTPALQNIDLTSRVVEVTGWGATEIGTASPDLLKVGLPVVPNEECGRIYNKSAAITYKQMCAGGANGQDSCGGDSGGPLVYPGIVYNSARIIQQGVVSFGPRRCGTEGQPGVYTRIAHYMDWILDNLRP